MPSISAPTRRRIALGLVGATLPMLAVAGASAWGLDTSLQLFRDTAEEAIEDALPLTRLETLVVRLQVSGLAAVSTGGNRLAGTAAERRATAEVDSREHRAGRGCPARGRSRRRA